MRAGRRGMLDIQSRNSVREFLIQLGLGLAIMLALFAASSQTLAELGQASVRVLTFYGVIDCLRASHRRDPVWGGSLNRWDQAAAYSFCAILIDAIMRWPR